MAVKINKLYEIEEDLLLEAIYLRYGYDFRNYARASLSRRLRSQANKAGLKYISDLIPKVLHNQNFFHQFLINFTINVTEMFRDPHFFLTFRKIVIPVLKTYPFFKIWHAGCSTGEEVYSLAILLKEEEMLGKANIYGTDCNPEAINKSKEGIYEIKNLEKYEENYLTSGGQYTLKHYYVHSHSHGKIINSISKNILFAEHNLVCDYIFSEVNVIFCRNVLIYFNKELQSKVLNLFYDSHC